MKRDRNTIFPGRAGMEDYYGKRKEFEIFIGKAVYQ